MVGAGSDLHRECAERAERLGRKACARLAHAIAAAEHHERLAREAGDGQGERHRRTAQMHRDAQAIHERAAGVQAEHADHERRIAERLRTDSASTRSVPSADSPPLATRYASPAHPQMLADKREAAADERERLADDRDRIADARDRTADARDRTADERDAVATAREDQLDEGERHDLQAARETPAPRTRG